MHTVWMLNRIINGSENKEGYFMVMQDIVNRTEIEVEIRNLAKSFCER